MIQDDRTDEEKAATMGFWIATDKFMSGWGYALGRSIVAVPCVSSDDAMMVERRLALRPEMKRVRWVTGNSYRPKLTVRDHLHIYNTSTSFRYPL